MPIYSINISYIRKVLKVNKCLIALAVLRHNRAATLKVGRMHRISAVAHSYGGGILLSHMSLTITLVHLFSNVIRRAREKPHF